MFKVDPLPNVPWLLKMAVTALVGGAITLGTSRLAANHTDDTESHKVMADQIDALKQKQTALEVHQEGDHETLKEIKTQVDKGNDKLDHLILDLLGERPKR